MAIVVSEETGEIAYARNGKLEQGISKEEITNVLSNFFK
jgi:DNA integrity scanning protein DisA with diadenylate cyclase activity